MPIDVLALGAHPDDIELSCGATVAKLARLGYSVALADLTAGELSTRGTPEQRAREAQAAAAILGVITRRNLNLPDGNIEVNATNRLKLITLIRELQPRLLLIPHSIERHPDHVHAHQLCTEAWFAAGLTKIETTLDGIPQPPFRPDNYFEFMQWYEFSPTFVLDVSETFDVKMSAIRAFESQFHNPNSTEPETVLSTPEFLKLIEARAAYYGQRIGARYGEPFYSYTPVGVNDLFDLKLRKG